MLESIVCINKYSNSPTNNLSKLHDGGLQNMGCMEKDIYNYERDWRNELKEHVATLLYDHFLAEQEKNPSLFFQN